MTRGLPTSSTLSSYTAKMNEMYCQVGFAHMWASAGWHISCLQSNQNSWLQWHEAQMQSICHLLRVVHGCIYWPTLTHTYTHTLALPLLFRLFHISCMPCAYRYCQYPIESLEKRNNCILDLEAHCSRIIRHLTARCMNYIWDRLRVCAYRKHSLMAGQDDWESSLRPWFPPLRRQLEELHDRWPVRYPVS